MSKFDAGKDWTFEDIDRCYHEIEKIAKEVYQLDTYPNQIEIITSEQMLDAYSAVGMPVYYTHWSFGKQFIAESERYKRGLMGLAYEIVINSNPCISYLMEENTMAMQALVMAHACFGHNSFFKTNHVFKQWTDADAILDYLVFAKHYISECEEKYGPQAVMEILDSAHALKYNGIDKYKRTRKLTKSEQEQRRKDLVNYEQQHYDDIWRTLPPATKGKKRPEFAETFPAEPEDNLLFFLEKHAPNMEPWKREILRIVRKTSQYFYPQMLTKVMNEGFATFFHYQILHQMYDRGLVTDGFMLEFLHSHSNVVLQRQYQSINPYALGFAMFMDIKRICTEPTDEDRKWFPDWAGNGDWLSTVKYAAANFKDESFVLQYLSPKVMRDMKLFYILDDDENPKMYVEAIHNEAGFREIRQRLSQQYDVNSNIPNIQVVDVNVWGDRSLVLNHVTYDRKLLDPSDTTKTLYHFTKLWGYDVNLMSVDSEGTVLEEIGMTGHDLSIVHF